ncbi:MAG TPA: dihydrolipoamide acetyltransferase family protein [Anaerolineales bacterium]|nr:dihydrolipoamide acetyltransferase family protein [Anaerolineales bacterium]
MAETISMPKLGFDMREGVLVRWVKNEGENINKGDVLAEIETDKATVEVESSASGVVRKLLASQGDVVPVGAAIAIVGSADEKIDVPAGAAQPAAAKAESKPAPQTPPTTPPITQAAVSSQSSIVNPQSSMIKASPLAKKIARDANVDLSRVQGSGPGGRVVRKDVEAALSGGQPSAIAAQRAPVMGPPSTVIVSHEDELITPTKLRQAIARRMTESKTSVPHFYVTHEYKMEALLDIRKQVNAYLPDDQKISVNDFIVKAVALTLREYPNLNSALQGNQVLRHGSVNVGVAVAVEGGLLTIVSKDTDQKPLRQIAIELKAMAARARSGKVHPDDIEGSTFSVSNLGMFDVENFAAIINPPEAGILAIGAAREVPVAVNGELKVGWRMKATISVDHRVSDGAEGAQFMQALAKYLEEPLRLLV